MNTDVILMNTDVILSNTDVILTLPYTSVEDSPHLRHLLSIAICAGMSSSCLLFSYRYKQAGGEVDTFINPDKSRSDIRVILPTEVFYGKGKKLTGLATTKESVQSTMYERMTYTGFAEPSS